MMQLYRTVKEAVLPTFADEEKNRVAGVLFATSVAVLAGLIITALYRVISGYWNLLPSLLLTLGMVVIVILLIRRGFVAFSASLFAWSLLALVNYLMLVNDGTHDSSLFALPGILVLAGLILSERYFYVFTGVSLFMVALMGYMEESGVIHNAYSSRVNLLDVLDLLVIFGLSAVTVRLMTSNLIKSLTLAKKSEKAIRTQAEQLKESEQSYRALFDGANDAIMIMNKERFLQCNDMTLKMFGYTDRSDIIGHSPWELSPTHQPDGRESKEKAAEIIRTVLNGTPQRFFWKHCKKDGSFFDAEVSISSVSSGKGVLLQALVRDISEQTRAVAEQKEAEKALKESEERMRAIVEGTPHLFFYTQDEHANTTYVSPTVEQITGYPPDVWSKRKDWFITDNPVNQVARETTRAHLHGEWTAGPTLIEVRHARGHPILLEAYEHPMMREGKVIGLQGVAHDITESKQTEDQLRKLSLAVEQSPASVIITDPTGRIEYVNPKFTRVTGLSLEEALGQNPRILKSGEQSREYYHQLWKTITSGGVWRGKLHNRKKDGQLYWEEAVISPIVDSDGRTTHFLAVKEDITERMVAEEALKASETQFRELWEATLEGILVHDHGIVLEVNESMCRMSGYRREQIVGRSLFEFVPPEFHDSVRERITSFREGSFELPVIRSDGNRRILDTYGKQIMYYGKPVRMVAFVDITERRQAEKRVKEQARLLDVARDAIIVRDMNDNLLYVNRAAEQLYGWTFEEAREVPSAQWMVESEREKFVQNKETFLRTGEWEGQLHQRTKDGREITVLARWTLVRNDDGQPSARLIINRDITEQRNLEAQFRRAQRLESLGTLAGGIAHDLNNVLAPITMALALMDRRTDDPVMKRYLTSLQVSAQRGSEIVKQVLIFARGSEKDFAPQQLRYIIREISVIIQETFPKNIQLQTDVSKDLQYVLGDATQLHQVMMNLCVNARDAMPNGGRLTISASNITLDENDASLHGGAKAGSYVVFTLSDTGVGIPRDIQEKIFEPFFTTKEVGKGTGLGLSTVYAIVKDHGGFLNLYSDVGQGTSFRVYLPALSQQREPETHKAGDLTLSGHGERVLVVDDEQAVLEITREILEASGYTVLTASNGAEAVAVFSAAVKGSIDLILTDVNMPGMDGPTALKAIRALDAGVKVIIASGVVTDLDPSAWGKLSIQGHLMKPYSTERMLSMIHEVLAKT